MRREASSDGSWINYTNGDELDDHLWQTRSITPTSSVMDVYLTDHQGSVRGILDGSGNLASSNGYDTFGNRSGTSATRFGYTGREHDPDTGLMYYRARWYSPETGRFVSEDPIGFDGGINLYAYVENNTLNLTDPTGNNPARILSSLWQIGKRVGAKIINNPVGRDVLINTVVGGYTNATAYLLGIHIQNARGCGNIVVPEPKGLGNAFLAGAISGGIGTAFDHMYPGGSRMQNFVYASASGAAANGAGQYFADLITNDTPGMDVINNQIAGALFTPLSKTLKLPPVLSMSVNTVVIGGIAGNTTSTLLGICKPAPQ